MGGSARTEMSVRIAPDRCPRVASLDYDHRPPVLMIAADRTAWVHVDLDGAPLDELWQFADRLAAAAKSFGEQLAEWEQRAGRDRTGPYVIPPVRYGIPGDIPDDVHVPVDGTADSTAGEAADEAADGGAGDAG